MKWDYFERTYERREAWKRNEEMEKRREVDVIELFRKRAERERRT